MLSQLFIWSLDFCYVFFQSVNQRVWSKLISKVFTNFFQYFILLSTLQIFLRTLIILYLFVIQTIVGIFSIQFLLRWYICYFFNQRLILSLDNRIIISGSLFYPRRTFQKSDCWHNRFILLSNCYFISLSLTLLICRTLYNFLVLNSLSPWI